jgi:hypothetical protein
LKKCQSRACPFRGELQPLENFNKNVLRSDGLEGYCKPCKRKATNQGRARAAARNRAKAAVVVTPAAQPDEFDIDVVLPDPAVERAKKRHDEAQRRLASDFESLRPGDFGTEDDYRAPNYDREKKQEFNETMGELMEFARGNGGDAEADRLSKYVSLLVEQESRWMNKRQARVHSLTHAREMLLARRFEVLARDLNWPATFGQYSSRTKSTAPARINNTILSDLHCGARLPSDENPIPFDVGAFNRRLAYVVRESCDIKPHYRDTTTLNLHFAGDGIEGNLKHSTQLDQDPTPVQLVAFARAMYAAVRYAAAQFPHVNVTAIGGNHGRDKIMHEGRALASRQYNFERAVALLVADRCKDLTNVTFDVPKAAVVVVPLFDKVMFVLHGDAEAKLKAPSASGGHSSWQQAIDKFNAEKLWAGRCDVLASGHFHDPAMMYFDTGVGLSNGMLVPPGGYGRAGGYRGPCGQFVFESVPGHAVGDVRYVRVGTEQDADDSLDEIIPPFVW